MDFVIRKGRKTDCKRTLELIQELAEYEKAPNEVTISLEELENDGFGENSIYELLVAEQNNQIIGIALYYEKY